MEYSCPPQLVFIFGLLGNVLAFLVNLALIPTFWTICWKNKSSEGFQSVPYLVALHKSMLILYYGVLKTNEDLIVISNAIGCALQFCYITLHIAFAPKRDKIETLGLMLIMNVGAFGLIIATTILLLKGSKRVEAVGWICSVSTVAVFAAPLTIMGRVVKTKSVEYMPFSLSLALTLSASAWFLYGFFIKDFFIALSNVVGFLFGAAQLILYMIYYKDSKKSARHRESMDDHR